MSAKPPKKKVANSLVAMSSAAVLAVYAAGYNRTRSAAQRIEAQAAERRPAPPVPAPAVEVHAPAVQEVEPVELVKEKPKKVAARVVEAPAAAAPEPKVETAAVTPPPPAPAPVEVEKPAAPPPPPPAPAAPPAPAWKDGTYTGWGTSRHGDIQAQVIIASGKIQSATIAQCLTRYSCSVIEALPPEVPQRQSPEVDYVTGATQSANAFYYAVMEALNKAK
jgi:uncharacterized protein with FMN-binding domain